MDNFSDLIEWVYFRDNSIPRFQNSLASTIKYFIKGKDRYDHHVRQQLVIVTFETEAWKRVRDLNLFFQPDRLYEIGNKSWSIQSDIQMNLLQNLDHEVTNKVRIQERIQIDPFLPIRRYIFEFRLAYLRQEKEKSPNKESSYL